jgi:Family of unknown function (DUF6163)
MLFGFGARMAQRSDSEHPLAAVPGLRSISWRRVLVWMFRMLAVAWMVKGLSAWATIIGLDTGPAFETRSLQFQSATVYFAVMFLVAAIGLWLTSTWGGVLWLMAVLSQLVLGYFFPRTLAFSTGFAITSAILVTAYFFISWAAAHEEN